MNPHVRNFVALAVTVVWIVSFLADIVMDSYSPDPLIHAAMMAVVTGAMASSVIKKNGNGD